MRDGMALDIARPLVAKVREYQAGAGQAVTQAALCELFAEDRSVFSAILSGRNGSVQRVLSWVVRWNAHPTLPRMVVAFDGAATVKLYTRRE